MKKKVILAIVIVTAIVTAWLLMRDNSNGIHFLACLVYLAAFCLHFSVSCQDGLGPR